MKYLCFLYILYIILPLFTEQRIIVLKPDRHGQRLHEILQLIPDAKSKLSRSKIVLQSTEVEIQEGTDTEELKQFKVTEKVSKRKEEESDPVSKGDNEEGTVYLLKVPIKTRGKKPSKFDDNDKVIHWSRLLSDIAAGDRSEISGRSPRNHHSHLIRRFVPQYLYSERPENAVAPNNKEIIPVQAPLEIVKKVAKQSMLEEAAKPQDDVIVSKALRSGDSWNAVWVEEVDPKSALRMSDQRTLGTIKAEIKPGNEFYDLVSNMTKISPRLLYIINDQQA